MAKDPADAAALLTRNAADALPRGGLEAKLAQAAREGRQLRVKLGLDPTAADIHLGHTVVLQKLREFQDLGHRVVLIVGDFTARVGDPSGRSSTRPVLSGAEIDANARTYQEQAFRVLLDDPERYELRFNSEWLDMPMEELFKLARTTTVAQILERDDFAKRWAAAAPISVLELLYPLMQGYDSVAVRSDVELGGTDQTFNLLLARDVQRAYGVPEQAILTVPILPGTDGVEKMSKSLGNHVGVAEPPEEVYGRTLRSPTRQWTAGSGCWASSARPRAPRRGTPSARSRAPSSSASTAPTPRAPPRRTSTASTSAMRLPTSSRRPGHRARQRERPRARAAVRRLRAVALGGAPAARPGRGQARRRGAGRPTTSTSTPVASTGPCCRSASASSAGCACGAERARRGPHGGSASRGAARAVCSPTRPEASAHGRRPTGAILAGP